MNRHWRSILVISLALLFNSTSPSPVKPGIDTPPSPAPDSPKPTSDVYFYLLCAGTTYFQVLISVFSLKCSRLDQITESEAVKFVIVALIAQGTSYGLTAGYLVAVDSSAGNVREDATGSTTMAGFMASITLLVSWSVDFFLFVALFRSLQMNLEYESWTLRSFTNIKFPLSHEMFDRALLISFGVLILSLTGISFTHPVDHLFPNIVYSIYLVVFLMLIVDCVIRRKTLTNQIRTKAAQYPLLGAFDIQAIFMFCVWLDHLIDVFTQKPNGESTSPSYFAPTLSLKTALTPYLFADLWIWTALIASIESRRVKAAVLGTLISTVVFMLSIPLVALYFGAIRIQ